MVRRDLRLLVGASALVLASFAAAPAAAQSGNIVLYAADAVDLHGHWTRAADASAAGGQLLTTPDTGWSSTKSASAAPTHYTDFTFTAAANTSYRVWVRLRATGNAKPSDSVFVQFSHATDTGGTTRYRIGTTQGLALSLQSCRQCSLDGWGWSGGSFDLSGQISTFKFTTSGTQTLRLQTREDGVQVDQIVLSPTTYLSSAPGAAVRDATIVARPAPSLSTPRGGTPRAVPGTILASEFDEGPASAAYHDATAGNGGKVYRTTDVDLEPSSEVPYSVGAVDPQEWLAYTVHVARAGEYTLEARVASLGAGGTFHVDFAGRNSTGVLSIPDTGGWQTWRSVSTRVSLAAGTQTMRIVFDTRSGAAVGNLAFVRLTQLAATPYQDVRAALPGSISVERFDDGGQNISYLDTTAGNSGGQARETDVDIAGSAGAGYYIDAITDGEWLDYSVDVAAAGAYQIEFDVAATAATGRIGAMIGSTPLPAMNVPATGGAQTWMTLSAPVVLSGGAQSLRVLFERGGFALKAIRLTVPPPPPPPPPSEPPPPPPSEPPPPPSTATIYTVNAAESLQAAIDAAKPGDSILLEAGATFVGNFVLPAKTGEGYITIRSSAPDSALPAEGVRTSPAYAAALPKLRSGNSAPALATAAQAHHYRLQHLEFLANAAGAGSIIALGDGGAAQNALDQVPYELIVDRVLIRGDAAAGQKRGIALNSASTSVINSYIADIKAAGQDSQAIGGWNGPGPYLIANNYLEAAGENIMFGGADPKIPQLVPSDITITGNHFFKPLTWRGTSWTVKNLLELKNAQRVLIDGNLLENNWLAAQAGYAVLMKSVNQDGTAPWSVVQDVVFSNNVVRNVSSAVNLLGRDAAYPAVEMSRITFRNNLFDNVNAAAYGGVGRMALVNGGVDITFDHNTTINDGSVSLYATSRASTNFVFTNNVLLDNAYGIKGDGAGEGNGTLTTYFPAAQVFGNIIVTASPTLYPTGNFLPATIGAVGFVDYAGRDYRLSASSIYRLGATDGTDPGVDYARLGAAFVSVQ